VRQEFTCLYCTMIKREGRSMAQMHDKKRICIVVFPFKNPYEECGQSYLSQYIRLIAPNVKELSVICGNYRPSDLPDNVTLHNIKAPTIDVYSKESALSQLHRIVSGQLLLTTKLIQLRRTFDIFNIYMWTGAIFLPTLIAKLFNKTIWLTVTGSPSKSSKTMYTSTVGQIIPNLIWLIEQTNNTLSNKIFLSGGQNMMNEMGLGGYSEKVILHAYNFYLDFDRLKLEKTISERQNIIGYIGRQSPDKGFMKFIECIKILNERNFSLRYLIIGDGVQRELAIKYLSQHELTDLVDILGWVRYDEVARHLNDIKIHVLASETEALGGTNLEAMACGAISIVNNVGGLPDTVLDGYNGFILEDNQPETIANRVIDVLNDDNLSLIQKNAREYVERSFSEQKVVELWRVLLMEND
jgi:glycosyltransferase involved in cell wall biosynthesis